MKESENQDSNSSKCIKNNNLLTTNICLKKSNKNENGTHQHFKDIYDNFINNMHIQ